MLYLEKNYLHKNLLKIGHHQKHGDHYHFTGKYRDATCSMCNLRFSVPNKILVLFHKRSNCNYNFIMTELASKAKANFEKSKENTEKCKTFSVPIEKEARIFDKDGNKDITAVSNKIKFTDSARFMASSLSNLINNLSGWIYKIKSKGCNCFLNTKVSKTI